MKRLALFVAGALLLSLAGIPTSALADSKVIDFENPPYTTGSIDGQDGWAGMSGGPISPAYDQAVVATGVFSSTQAFRMSNAVTSGEFALWPYSPSLLNEAGETSAVSDGFSGGTRQSGFSASFNFASTVPGAEQPGLQVSISPDRGDGARMSFIRLRDTSTGLAVDFADYQSGSSESGCLTGANFVTTTVATALDRSVPHTIRLTMDFIDGPANDIVKVYVDGTTVHTGTSWEDYYRECELNPTRPVDSLIFQARTQSGDVFDTWAANAGNGFLFDNVSYSSGPRAQYADLSVSKTDAPDPVHVGHKLTYTIPVTNNGPDSATGVTLTDNLPKNAGFGSATMTNGGTCTLKPKKNVVVCSLTTLASGSTATATIVVKPTVKGTVTNTVSVTATSPTDQKTANNTASAITTVLP